MNETNKTPIAFIEIIGNPARGILEAYLEGFRKRTLDEIDMVENSNEKKEKHHE